MCFSATASFVATGVLTVAGTAALSKVRSRSEIPFAVIPFLFGAQQFCEGMLWLSLNRADLTHLQQPFTYAFLTFAQIVWPLWVPLAVLLMEPAGAKRKTMDIMFYLGASVSGMLGFCLLYFPVTSTAGGGHIHYIQEYPMAGRIPVTILYLVATVVTPIISSVRSMHLLGWLVLLSFITAHLFYTGFVLSVWCFFAALISGVIVFILARSHSSAAKKGLTTAT